MTRKIARKTKLGRWRLAAAAAASSSLMSLNLAGIFFLGFQPFTSPPYVLPPTPQEYLAEQCQAPDCDIVLLSTIIACESGWRMVKNSSSSAYGYFQIIDGTERTTPQYHAGERKFDPYSNIDMGLYLYETRGTNPWNSSRGCWHRRYREAIAQDVEAVAE